MRNFEKILQTKYHLGVSGLRRDFKRKGGFARFKKAVSEKKKTHQSRIDFAGELRNSENRRNTRTIRLRQNIITITTYCARPYSYGKTTPPRARAAIDRVKSARRKVAEI